MGEVKYTLKGKDLKNIQESISKKIKINENFEEDLSKDTENLLLDENINYGAIKNTGKIILKQALDLRRSIIDSKTDVELIKLIKGIEKLAEDLSNYEYKNLPIEKKNDAVSREFDNKITESE